ncbi:hypothetical protein DID73_00015 [Candidatus Marinamargulisbacteria bacterium SCGC AG-343-K17]|nr:hypothetical protein DID73_00015 [Candidatus Marinamargulisbacteria bacterium SCGC AG-343-K17]
MQIFSAFDIPPPYTTSNTPASTAPTDDADLSDPDSMYEIWIKPHVDIFEAFTKDNWKNELDNIFNIYLELKKNAPKITSHSLLKEMSIQVSVYEALIFRDMLLDSKSNHWTLSKCDKTDNPNEFQFKNQKTQIKSTIKKNKVYFKNNQLPIGHLTIDMENIILEKLHGTLFDKPFILDPIWLKKQRKVDAVKIQIDQFKTEIVHKKNHMNTLWTGGNEVSQMTISKNESLSINKQLLLNFKKIHWKSFTLYTFQWITPWYRLPIQGQYKLVRD